MIGLIVVGVFAGVAGFVVGLTVGILSIVDQVEVSGAIRNREP